MGSERIAFLPDLDELLDEASRLLHVTGSAFGDSPQAVAILERVGAEFAGDGLTVRPLPVAADPRPDGTLRWGGTDVVLGPLAEGAHADRFELRPETLAVRLLRDGDRVVGAVLRDQRTGAEEEVRADAVVVAANAFGTPQLLWASGIRPEALGRYLTEHPLVFGIVAVREGVLPPPDRDSRLQTDPIRGVVSVAFGEGHPFHAQLMYSPVCPVPLPDGSPYRDNPAGYAMVGYGLRKFPRPEDRLTFDESTPDANGLPGVVVSYDLTDREFAEIEEAKKFQARAAGVLGDFVENHAAAHAAGDLAALHGHVPDGGADDGTSVCDPDSRVWGVPGLVLAGNGLIPTANALQPDPDQRRPRRPRRAGARCRPRGEPMTRTFPTHVDVAIVGSGPDRRGVRAHPQRAVRPTRRSRIFEAGPVLTDPPGLHVKNIADLDERRARPAPLGGSAPHSRRRHSDDGRLRRRRAERVVRPGTLPAARRATSSRGRTASRRWPCRRNVGGMGAHWTVRLPAARRRRADRLPARPGRAARRGRAAARRRPAPVRRRPLRRRRARPARPPSSTPAGPRSGGCAPMPLAVHRRRDGALVTWSGPDVVFGDVTRANPNFTLFAEALVSRVLVEDGRAVGVVVRDLRTAPSTRCAPASSSSPPTRCAPRSCCWPPASARAALGRYLNDQPQMVFAVRLRDVAHTAGSEHDPRGDTAIVPTERRQLGALHRRATPSTARSCSSTPRRCRWSATTSRRPGTHRRAGLVLRQGPAGVRPGRVLRRRDRRLRHAEPCGSTTGSPSATTHSIDARGRRSCARPRRSATRRRRAAHACRPARRCTTRAPPGWERHDDGTSVCGPTSRSGASPACTSPATASSRPPIACNPTLTSVALAVGAARHAHDRRRLAAADQKEN